MLSTVSNYKNKHILYLIFLTLLGLNICVSVIKYNLSIFTFIIGICLLLVPVIIHILNFKTESSNVELITLCTILTTVFFLHYLFYVKYDFIVGSDAPFHYFMTTEIFNEFGKFNFMDLKQVSFQFPLMYVFYNMLSLLTNLNVSTLAVSVHPSLNILSIVFFYMLLRKTCNTKFALISIFMIGWEYTTFFYGFEFRTESFAIVLFTGLIYLVFMQLDAPQNTSYKIPTLVLSFSIVMSHFLTCIHTLIILSILLILLLIKRKLRLKDLEITTFYQIFSISLLSYMLYLSNSFDTVFGLLLNLMTSVLKEGNLPNIGSGSFYGGNHGFIVFFSLWLSRLTFILGTLLFIKHRIKNKNIDLFSLFIFMWTFVYLILTVLTIVTKLDMSPERIYHFFSFGFIFFVSYLVYNLSKYNRYTKVLAILMVLLISTYPVFSMPSWIVSFNNPADSNKNEIHFEYTPTDITAANFAKTKTSDISFIGDQRTEFVFKGLGGKKVEKVPVWKKIFTHINNTILDNISMPKYLEIRTDDKNFLKYSISEFQNHRRIYDNGGIQIHLISSR